jgi:ketosteroid isomerase-like protein
MIGRLENLHSRLIIEGKGDSLLDMYSEDPQIIQNGLTFYNGKQGVIDFWKKENPYLSHVRTMIKLDGDNEVLYETGIEAASGTAKDGDQEFRGSNKYLVIWKKENGNWKIALEMWNALPVSDPKDGD